MTQDDNELVTARLINWGLWVRGGMPYLGYPAWTDIWHGYFPSKVHITPDCDDAEHIEYIVSSLDIAGRGGLGLGDIYAFICRLEYVEIERPRMAKAEHVRRKYNVPCSERTFRYHLYNAKRAVHMLYERPLSLPANMRYAISC